MFLDKIFGSQKKSAKVESEVKSAEAQEPETLSVSEEMIAAAAKEPVNHSDDLEEITELKFTVRFSDCDEHSRLRLSRLFQFTEEAALADAQRKGYGLWNMLNAGYGCVVTRMKLRWIHTPVLGEELYISTWAKENYKDKVIYKDYMVKDGRGNILVEGTSSWLLVDMKTMKAVPPSTSPFPVPIEEGREALPEKLDILPMGLFPKVVDQVQGRNTDLDINHHVNVSFPKFCA